MKTAHIYMDTDTGNIEISAYDIDDPVLEHNHIVINVMRNSMGSVHKHSSAAQILSNVLNQLGVMCEIEINGE